MESTYSLKFTASDILIKKGFWLLLPLEAIVVAFYNSGGAVLLGILLGTLLLLGILYKPFWGLTLYVFVFPFSISFSQLGSIALARLIGILTLLGIFLDMAINVQTINLRMSKESKFIVFFLGAAFLSAIFGEDFIHSISVFFKLSLGILFLWMIIRLVNEEFKLEVFLWSLALSGALFGALGLHQVFTGQLYRAEGLMNDPNFFALSLVPLISISFSMIYAQKPIVSKVLLSICFAISLLAMVLSFSRGGIIASAIAILYFVFRQKRRFRYLLLLVLALFFLYYVTGDVFHLVITSQNFFSPTRTASSYKRLLILVSGLKMFLSHPVFGVGIGNFASQVGSYSMASSLVSHYSSHNTPLEIACEMGILGFLPFIILMFLVFKSLEKSYQLNLQNGKKEEAAIITGIQSALIGYLVGFTFLNGLMLKHLWILIALSFVMRRFSPMNLNGR